MTFFSAIPVPETQIGIAFETERGVPVPPEYWTPIMGPKYKPDLKLLPDEGLRGSMVTLYDEVPSLRFDGHGWDAYPYLDTLPVFIKALLGSPDNKTEAPASTKLVKEAKAGDNDITTEETIPAGSYITVGTSSNNRETHLTGTPVEVKGGEWTIPVAYPLAFSHPSAAPIVGLTKHAFSLLNNSPSTGNQPPSCTLTDYDGEESWRQLAAAQLDSLTISGSADSLPKVATNWFANAATTPEAPVASYSTAEAPPGWALYASIGGTQVGYLVDWEYALKRSVKNVPAITGTQNYYQHFADALDATAKITVLEDPKATWLSAYERGEELSLDLTINDVQSGFACNFHTTTMKFTTGEIDRSKEWVEVPLEIQLIPTATDALAGGVSPIAITVANATTTTY